MLNGIFKLSCSHHSLDVLVFTLVQTLVDVAEPQAVGADECESDDKEDDVCHILRGEDQEEFHEKERHGECKDLDKDHDPVVLYHGLAGKLLIERCCLLVVNGELHEEEIIYSSRECHV